MSSIEQKNSNYKAKTKPSEAVNELEIQKIPQELKDLQALTGISDEHTNKLYQTYKDELETSPLLL